MKLMSNVKYSILIVIAALFLLGCRGVLGGSFEQDNQKFTSSVKRIIDSAEHMDYPGFLAQSSKKGLVVAGCFSAGGSNTGFYNEIPKLKIPKNLDFASQMEGAKKLTIPGAIGDLRLSPKPDVLTCDFSASRPLELDLAALGNSKAAESKVGHLARHFYRVFSQEQAAKNDFSQICVLSKNQSQAYYALISAPEDGDNEQLYGVLLVFESENHEWKLRGISEFF